MVVWPWSTSRRRSSVAILRLVCCSWRVKSNLSWSSLRSSSTCSLSSSVVASCLLYILRGRFLTPLLHQLSLLYSIISRWLRHSNWWSWLQGLLLLFNPSVDFVLPQSISLKRIRLSSCDRPLYRSEYILLMQHRVAKFILSNSL